MDKWSPAEDDIVMRAVLKYGSNQWNRVASLLSRKNASQCRARWFEVLDSRISHEEWSSEEDAVLVELARRMPNMWRSVGATLGGRSAAQCHERYEWLINNETPKPKDETDTNITPEIEKQLLEEVNARLSQSLGRKAKRKNRERAESEAKFLEAVQRYRDSRASLHTKGASVPHIETEVVADTPTVGPIVSPKNPQSRPPRSKRPKLALSPPKCETSKHRLQSIVIPKDTVKALERELDNIPEPSGLTLRDLEISKMA